MRHVWILTECNLAASGSMRRWLSEYNNCKIRQQRHPRPSHTYVTRLVLRGGERFIGSHGNHPWSPGPVRGEKRSASYTKRRTIGPITRSCNHHTRVSNCCSRKLGSSSGFAGPYVFPTTRAGDAHLGLDSEMRLFRQEVVWIHMNVKSFVYAYKQPT
ncbi:hypothetical protein BD309DRAFT_738829 [Dichomitus squalens]|nr:hypothetical protein BD309DRAFT_738829 [Dichomitus squalens]